MGFFIDNVLGSTLVHERMGFQLEQQVQHIHEQQNLQLSVRANRLTGKVSHNARASAYTKNGFVGHFIIRERGMESGLGIVGQANVSFCQNSPKSLQLHEHEKTYR